MDEKSYTAEEFRQALRETGNTALTATFTDELVTQMDKNRLVKNCPCPKCSGEGFTEEQVRRALAESVHRPGSQEVKLRGLYWSTESFTGDVIRRLRDPESKPAFVPGGVYRSPSGVLYKRTGDAWEAFGSNVRLTGNVIRTEDLEWVL